MSFTYTYKIVGSNKEAKTMDVIYETEGKQPISMACPLPSVGEDLTSIIKQYAPIQVWLELDREVQDIPVGVTGVITPESSIVSDDVAEPPANV